VSSTETAIRELDKRIRSRIPIIYIPTQEERRVVEGIARYAQQPVHNLAGQVVLPGRQVFKWTVTNGLVPLSIDADTGQVVEHELDPERYDMYQAQDQDGAFNPRVAMQSIGEYVLGSADKAGTAEGMAANASIFLMLDLHRYVSSLADEGMGEPVFQRALRDLYGKVSRSRSVVVIVSPRTVNLGDCEAEVDILDWPLPDQDELSALIHAIAAKLPAHIVTDLNGSTARLAAALAGLTLEDAESAILGAVYETGGLIPEKVIPYVVQAKREAVSKTAGLEYIDHTESLNSVGGLDLLKQTVAHLNAIMTPEALGEGVEPIDGILLVGVPGCGKSLMAKAIAGGRMPCVRQNVGEQFSGLLGGTEANFRASFRILEALGACIWHIDEIEKLFGSSGGELDGGTGRRILGMLLTFMEERKQRAPVVLPVVTANDVSSIPPELLNRFELVFFVDLPDEASCAEIIGIHLAKRSLQLNEADVRERSRIAHGRGLNGREIERAVKAARRRNFSTGEPLLDALHRALDNAVGITHTMPQKIAAIRDWGKRHALPASSTQEAAAVPVAEAGLLL